MTTLVTNKAGEVVQWHDWCARDGHPHSDQDARNYILRRWPEIDADIREQIFFRSQELLKLADT